MHTRVLPLGLLLLTVATAPAAETKDEFSKLVKMAPFVVNGKSLSISVFARTSSDRRYGESFSQEVVKVIYEGVTEETGNGLIVIGAKGEPHPSLVFRKFLALAKDGNLDPAVAERGAEIQTELEKWERIMGDSKKDRDRDSDDVDMNLEQIFTALPMQLRGMGSKLYQLAWEQKFDEKKVEAKLLALRPADLERPDLFKSYDWAFYLPPKGALDNAIDDVISAALKKEKLGFVARTAVKGVLLVVKPKIRRAIEGMRQSFLFLTVVRAQTQYSEKESHKIADAYFEVLMPFEVNDSKKKTPPAGRTEHERAVNAVKAAKEKIVAGSASDPITPPPASPESGTPPPP